MMEIEELRKKQKTILAIVCINFALFMVLFAGMGYVTYQSVALVKTLRVNLDKAETTVAQLQDRFQQLDTDAIVERLVVSASQQVSTSLQDVVQNTDLATPITQMSEDLRVTREKLDKTHQALTEIHETVKGLEKQELIRQAANRVIQERSDDLHNAPDKNQPDTMNMQALPPKGS